MTQARFRQLVEQALATIPRRFRAHLKNVAVVVEDRPSPELLADLEIEPPDTLFGLYQGTPLTERRWDYGNTLPDRITIYQRPIEEVCATEEEIIASIGETLIHEVGHYFGMTEEQLERIEQEYWRTQMPGVENEG